MKPLRDVKNGFSFHLLIILRKNNIEMNLSIQQIEKTYSNGVKALDHISFELGAGMFGLLGPNGAGKSSLMRTIATLQFPDKGEILFQGKNIFDDKIEYRKSLGYLPQEFGVYPKESAQSLLDYFAILKGISSKKDRGIAVDKVLQITNLQDVRKKRVSTFSGGMRQRFGIAQLLLNEPKVIIVDEPTAGLDPAERTRFLNVLRNIGTDNIVIFSTHLVEDVRELCHDMAVIHQGELLSQISPKTATNNLKEKIWETELDEDSIQTLQIPFVKLSDRYNDENQIISRIYSEVELGGEFERVNPKLEDFYFLILKNNA